MASAPPPAGASSGYELDATSPTRSFTGQARGIAVDQSNHDIYVAITSVNTPLGLPGQIDRFNSDLSADGVFASGEGFYTGVAVDPGTHGFYAFQDKLDFTIGTVGIPRMDVFTSAGASSGNFAVPDPGSLPPIATDSTGRVFYPYTDGHTVQVYNSVGVLQNEITCADCPGGSFDRPVSVAIGAANSLYVVDTNPDRVVKLTPSGDSYSYASTVQSNRSAVAVGVDPTSGDVLVGDLPSGRNYHIVAYDSSGTQFDDFGAGLFADPPFQDPPEAAINLAYQMAIDGTSHKVYVGENEKFYVFEKTTIAAPSGEIKPASSVGQITATMNATVNVHGHAALSCNFEYTDAADTGFSHPTTVACPSNPNSSSNTALAMKLSSLTPATAYRYRLKATTNGGSFTSGSETFTTLPQTPATVTTESPQSVAQTSATLKGTVNPQGGSPSDCHFELGTSLSYGTNLSCASLPGPVVSNVAVNRSTTGLSAGTTYHYRLVFTTNAGTTVGNDVAFTTKSPPSEPVPEEPSSNSQPSAPSAPTPEPTTSPVTTTPRPLRCKKGFRKARVHGKVKCVKRKRPKKHKPPRNAHP